MQLQTLFVASSQKRKHTETNWSARSLIEKKRLRGAPRRRSQTRACCCLNAPHSTRTFYLINGLYPARLNPLINSAQRRHPRIALQDNFLSSVSEKIKWAAEAFNYSVDWRATVAASDHFGESFISFLRTFERRIKRNIHIFLTLKSFLFFFKFLFKINIYINNLLWSY